MQRRPRARAERRSGSCPVGVPAATGEALGIPGLLRVRRRGPRPAGLYAGARRDAEDVALPTTRCPQWVVANRSGVGYYLPRLTPALYASLGKAERVLAGADYAVLLADMEMLARSGAIRYQEVLPLAARRASDPDRAWPRCARSDLAAAFRRRWSRLPTTRSSLRGFAAGCGSRARALGWLSSQGDTPEVLRLRETALPLVAERGHDAALARARAAPRATLAHSPQGQSAGYPSHRTRGDCRATMGQDAPRLFDALLVIAKSGKDRNERDDALAALGQLPRPALLARAMALRPGSANRRARRADGPGGGAVSHPATRPAALTAWFRGPCRRPDPDARAKCRVTFRHGPMARARPASARSSSRCSSRAPPTSTRETAVIANRSRKSTSVLALRAAQEAPLIRLPGHDQMTHGYAHVPSSAVFMIVGAVACFAVGDSIARTLTARYPVPLLVWTRWGFQVIVMLIWLAPTMGTRIVHTRQLRMQLIRGVLLIGSSSCFLSRCSGSCRWPTRPRAQLPDADAGDRAGRRVPARAAGAGAPRLRRRRRRGDADDRAAGRRPVPRRLAARAAHPPPATPVYQITTRMLAGEDPRVTLFYPTLVGAGLMTLIWPWFGSRIDITWTDVALIAAIGTLGTVAHFLFILAFQRAPASALTRSPYIHLVFATLIGWLRARRSSRCVDACRHGAHRQRRVAADLLVPAEGFGDPGQ